MVWLKVSPEVVKMKYGSYVINKSTLTSGFTRGMNTSPVFFDPPIHPDLLSMWRLSLSYTSWFTITWITYELILWDIYELQCITFCSYGYKPVYENSHSMHLLSSPKASYR